MYRRLVSYGLLLILILVGVNQVPLWLPAKEGDRQFLQQLLRSRRTLADAARQLETERQAARQAGLPLRAEDLQRPPLPEARNAAALYVELERLLAERPFAREERWLLRERLRVHANPAEEELAAARRLLQERRDVRELVLRAAARPECAFEFEWTQGYYWDPPEGVEALDLSLSLLTAEAYLLAAEGRSLDALAVLANAARVESHSAAEPYWQPTRVEHAYHLEGVATLLYFAEPRQEVARAVRQFLADHPFPDGQLERQLAGDAVLGAATFQRLRTEGLPHLAQLFRTLGEVEGHLRLADLSARERRAWGHFVDAVEAAWLRRNRELLAALALPTFQERDAALAQADPSVELEEAPTALLHERWGARFTRPTREFHRRLEAARARREILVAGAAVLAYRAREGRFPERLEQALPEPPLDPFTGRPLQYRREGDGFVIYSVGPDRDFDGGAPDYGWSMRYWEPFFRYPAPPPEGER